ncbi:MAG: BatD family protein [Myxococcota bacterium]
MSRVSIPLLAGVLALLAGALVPATAAAQTADVSMSANRTRVAVGDTLVLRVQAEVEGGTVQDVVLPDLPGFQVVSRQTSRPFSFSFGFGTRGRTVQSRTEHVLQLRALEPGTHRIEPAKAIVAGRTFASEPLTIEVTGSPDDALQGDDTGQGAPPDADAPEVDGADFDSQAFLRTVVDESEPYVGQQVTVSIYLYVRGGLRTAPAITEEPSTKHFWVHDLLPPSRSLDASQQTVRGVPFRVYELRRFAAFPLRAGKSTIGPMEVRMKSGSLLDLFRGGGRSLERRGVPVTLDVQPLPEPAPDEVVVGRFHVEAELDRDTVTTGDAATLRVQVEGTGNPHDVALELPEVEGLRVLAPRIEDEVRAPNDVVGGTRTFEWLLVPEEPGTYRLPPLGFATFDPATESYGEVRSEPLELEAVGRPASTSGDGERTAGSEPSQRDDAPRFGPVRTVAELGRAEPAVSRRPWYPVALAVPPFAWLAFLGAGRVRRRLRARDEARAGLRSVRRRLREARGHAAQGEPRAFYAAIAQAIGRAIATKLNEPVGGLTHDDLRRHLDTHGIDPDLTRRLVDELEGCDFARFSATGVSADEMERTLERVAALLQRLERTQPGEAAA